jgi:hypothetical protein
MLPGKCYPKAILEVLVLVNRIHMSPAMKTVSYLIKLTKLGAQNGGCLRTGY